MTKLLLAVLFIPTIHGMELIQRNNISAADQSLRLYSNKKEFYVEDESAAYRVDTHNINPLLNEVVKRKALDKFKKAGYIKINKLEQGKYQLIANVRGEGGFLLTGVIVYQSCRVIGYSGLLLGSVGTIVAATAGGGPVAGFVAASQVIQASAPAAAAIESSSLAIGTAASWIPGLP